LCVKLEDHLCPSEHSAHTGKVEYPGEQNMQKQRGCWSCIEKPWGTPTSWFSEAGLVSRIITLSTSGLLRPESDDRVTMSDQEFEIFSLMEGFLWNLSSLRPQNQTTCKKSSQLKEYIFFAFLSEVQKAPERSQWQGVQNSKRLTEINVTESHIKICRVL
jgi:hypothetical protein